MKVDKAVCTNGTLGDLGRAIQFEAVFSTLVENKMLAIKRECEFKKRHKKSRLLRKAVFNRKVTTACCHQSVTTSASGSISAGDPDGTSEPDYADRNGALAEHASGSAAGWRIYESEDRRANGAASLAIDNSLISDDADEVIVEIGDLSSLVDSDGNVVVTTNAVDSARRFQADIPRDECYSPSLVRDNPVSTAVNLTPTSSDSGQPSNADVRTRESTVIKAGVPPQRSDQKTTTRKPSVFEPISIEIEHESFDLNDSATNVAMELDGVRGGVSGKRGSTASEPISIIKNSVQQHATAASAAGYRFGTGSYLSPGSAVNRLRLLEAKSISAQNSPILRRQRTGTEGRHLTFSPATYRQHSSTKTSAIECDSSLMDLSKAEANHLQHLQQHQQHYNSTVIVKEQKLVPVAGDGRRTARGGTTKATQLLGTNGGSSSSASMKNKLAQKNCNNHSAIADDDNTAIGEPMAESPSTLGFIESFNQLTASNLAVIATHTARQSPPVSDTVKLQHCRRPPRGTTTYCSVGELNKPHVQDPSPSASHKLPPPAYSSMVDETVSTSMVKTAELAKSITNLARASGSQRHRKESDFLRQSSCNVELHHGPTTSGTVTGVPSQVAPGNSCHAQCSRRSNAKEHHHRKGNGAGSYGYGDSSYIMGYDVNESDEDKLNKRKYKYLKRCSDPVIVFPTTSGSGGSGGGSGRGGDGASGLQHCILSRPPNQLIQFPYDEDLMYDISMQMESDCHGELDSIVSEKKKKHKHRHHHHHHRHCKKTRHKKRKILVHDLDDQSVKVIDPDDLPQRARWTIIATACLLLIMCLLLVGITLRMAPIIDDMVRQENERLMRESLDRAKMIKNYTEYNRMIGGDETP